jgi:hypothetical protein
MSFRISGFAAGSPRAASRSNLIQGCHHVCALFGTAPIGLISLGHSSRLRAQGPQAGILLRGLRLEFFQSRLNLGILPLQLRREGCLPPQTIQGLPHGDGLRMLVRVAQ